MGRNTVFFDFLIVEFGAVTFMRGKAVTRSLLCQPFHIFVSGCFSHNLGAGKRKHLGVAFDETFLPAIKSGNRVVAVNKNKIFFVAGFSRQFFQGLTHSHKIRLPNIDFVYDFCWNQCNRVGEIDIVFYEFGCCLA